MTICHCVMGLMTNVEMADKGKCMTLGTYIHIHLHIYSKIAQMFYMKVKNNNVFIFKYMPLYIKMEVYISKVPIISVQEIYFKDLARP